MTDQEFQDPDGSSDKLPSIKSSFALLVDGYVRDLFITGMVLQRLGYDVHIANTGEDALKIIDAALPVLMITELALPNMSGLELLVRLKHDPQTKTIPIIIHTSLNDPKREELCRATGCSAILKKPVDPEALYSAIQQATEATPRQHIRLKTLLPVRVGGLPPSSNAASTEYVSTLTETSIFVRTLTPRPIGAVLPVTIIIHSIPVKLKAVVLRAVTMNRGMFKEPGMVLKFVEISGTDQELLKNFIKGQIMKDVQTQQ
jgi:CheY-like chemotaxis protein